ncbi:MAG: hypothetical protein ACI85I_001847 [Arenicella sp.]|jgi:hypothetical protein
MKHFKITFLAIVFTVFAQSIQAQDFSKAVEYLGYITNQFNNISEQQWEYTKAVSKGKGAKKVDKRRMELLQSIKEAKGNIFKMPRFNGDASYKVFAIKRLDVKYSILNEDYAKIVNMEEVAEQSYDLMEVYLLTKQKANEKLAEASVAMDEETEKFAEANNIRLLENDSKLSKRMSNASEVWSYYNKYYLTFFKAKIQESYALDGLSKKDVSAVEQSKNAMVTFAKEGLDSLIKFQGFRGDASLMQASKEVMNFYISEGEQMSVYTDYFIKKDKFEKIKANFEKIKQNKRTKADVDGYNKGVNDMNAALEKYNKVNDQLNKSRSKAINNWNKTVDSFLKKHVS